jgi:hypothetical protein
LGFGTFDPNDLSQSVAGAYYLPSLPDPGAVKEQDVDIRH